MKVGVTEATAPELPMVTELTVPNPANDAVPLKLGLASGALSASAFA